MVESESSSSSSTWEDFFSESEDEIDIVLNEQDAIISNLTEEVKQLDAYSDHLLEELTELRKYVKHNGVKCSRILRKLIEDNVNHIEEYTISQRIIKDELVYVLRILNNLFSKVI